MTMTSQTSTEKPQARKSHEPKRSRDFRVIEPLGKGLGRKIGFRNRNETGDWPLLSFCATVCRAWFGLRRFSCRMLLCNRPRPRTRPRSLIWNRFGSGNAAWRALHTTPKSRGRGRVRERGRFGCGYAALGAMQARFTRVMAAYSA